jgi:hypothetical protein
MSLRYPTPNGILLEGREGPTASIPTAKGEKRIPAWTQRPSRRWKPYHRVPCLQAPCVLSGHPSSISAKWFYDIWQENKSKLLHSSSTQPYAVPGTNSSQFSWHNEWTIGARQYVQEQMELLAEDLQGTQVPSVPTYGTSLVPGGRGEVICLGESVTSGAQLLPFLQMWVGTGSVVLWIVARENLNYNPNCR